MRALLHHNPLPLLLLLLHPHPRQCRYAFEVEESARAADGASVLAVRSYVVAACAQPSSANYLICRPEQVRLQAGTWTAWLHCAACC